MSLSEFWRCIFVAWVLAVGWFRGVMSHQQNNEGPLLPHNFGPASPNPAKLQHNVINVNGANDCKFDQNPKLRVAQPNIQQDKGNLQYNAINANAAKTTNFAQNPIAEIDTHGTQPIMQQLFYGILIAIAIAVGICTNVMLYIRRKMKDLLLLPDRIWRVINKQRRNTR